jgi:hypothetical protein
MYKLISIHKSHTHYLLSTPGPGNLYFNLLTWNNVNLDEMDTKELFIFVTIPLDVLKKVMIH